MAITLTEKAAGEVKRIITEQQRAAGAPEKIYLRMRVVGGGCSGFQHKLDLDPVDQRRSSTRSSSSTACRSSWTSAA